MSLQDHEKNKRLRETIESLPAASPERGTGLVALAEPELGFREKLRQLITKWENIAEDGEGTPVTDDFKFRCAMERCAAELKAEID